MVQMYNLGVSHILIEGLARNILYLNAYQYPLEIKRFNTTKLFKINLWKIINQEKKISEILDCNRLKKDKHIYNINSSK